MIFSELLKKASIGCRIKVQLAYIIFTGANVLLLDEPTNHIDLLDVDRLEQQLLEFKGILIAVSHDKYFIDRIKTKQIDLDVQKGNFHDL